ncbi:hypothetical protein [Alteriqipengyuania sp. 357]
MIEKPQKTHEFRYRLYFWLMDACLVGVAIGSIDAILDSGFGVHEFGLTAAQSLPIVILVNLFSFIVPVFLMVAKFMRDEYADQLWRRSVVVLAYVAATVPLTILLIENIAFFALGQPEKAPGWLRWWVDELPLRLAVLQIWQSYVLIFVAIFQFLRWRDSR